MGLLVSSRGGRGATDPGAATGGRSRAGVGATWRCVTLGVRRLVSDAQVQGVEDLTQQVVQLTEQPRQRSAVEQAGDGAQQVAEQVAGSGGRDDVEHDLVEVDLQAKEVEVERSEDEVQDVA